MATQETKEANFDGLVGPTHNYAGLSYGNIASFNNRAAVANPKEAALQGLTKAKSLADLGHWQGIIPPQERPDIRALHALGFSGSDEEILQAAAKKAPEILAAMSSASCMWTANAATVSPSADSLDKKVHFTAANLNQKLHRSIEHQATTRLLKAIFPSPQHFVHHDAVIASDALGDEGAANHTRFCKSYGEAGLQFFVYGRSALEAEGAYGPKLFPARQTKEASEALARLHRLREEDAFFAQQSAESIDGGAFHNDVISVGNRNVLFYHEQAFREGDKVVARLTGRFEKQTSSPFIPIKVLASEVPIQDAVKSYLFNSQLISIDDNNMVLVAPQECQETPSVQRYLERLLASAKTPIQQVMCFDLRQSMRNGGGPACLRLRVVLTQAELKAMNQSCLLTTEKFTELGKWVERNYRDRLAPEDVRDPQLLRESRTALDELSRILNLGSVYDFQK